MPLVAAAAALENLKRLSLEELTEVEVTSVSRRSEKLVVVPAAVEVLTGARIQRAGVQTLPDALRLATGLQVTQLSGREWAVSARGFASLASEKMEVAQDGRTLYSPLFSGVAWDVQTVLWEDLDRIEVVRGPGAALWGSNAVNGVISIVTKSAAETQGSYANATVGSHERHAALRYGGRAGETFYRVYVLGTETDGLELASGAEAADTRRLWKAGVRTDQRIGQAGELTLQGEFYAGRIGQVGLARSTVEGGHALARYELPWSATTTLRAQTLLEATRRDIPGTYAERRQTWDTFVEAEFEQEQLRGTAGVRARVSRDEFERRASLYFDPLGRTVNYLTFYAQARLALPDERWSAVAGASLEHSTFADWVLQPTVRIAYAPDSSWMVWAAASRAARTPSRIDADVVVPGPGGLTFLAGNPHALAEKLESFELGWRWQAAELVSVSVNGFVNRYRDLRTIEPATPPVILRNDNLLEGETEGVEVQLLWRPFRDLRFVGGARWLDKDLRLLPASQSTFPLTYQGNDARRVMTAQLSWDVRPEVQADVVVRHVSALPRPAVPAYTELDARLAWDVTPHWELAASGRNLLHARHREHVAATPQFVPRSFFLSLTWRR